MSSLDVRLHPAGYGDCILLTSGSNNILFDGGTASSYGLWCENIHSLDQINALFVTHLDNDHIGGVIRLIDDNKEHSKPKILKIERIFFNGVEQIFECDINESNENQHEFVSLESYYSDSDESQEIGYSEGTGLSYLLKKFKYPVNDIVNGKVICRESIDNFDILNFNITVIGPSLKTIKKLKSNWDNELKTNKIKNSSLTKQHAAAFEKYIDSLKSDDDDELSGYISSSEKDTLISIANSKYIADQSLANKSSICVLVKAHEKSILMLGDTTSETVIEWMDENKISELKVDAVKVSHHGSKKNLNKELISRLITKNYLFSTDNSKYSHPDIETLARIVYFSKCDEVNFHFNSKSEHIDYGLFDSIGDKKITFNHKGALSL